MRFPDDDTPTIIDYPTARGGEVTCSPDEWLRHSARLLAEGSLRVVHLDAVPDGAPWDDDASEFDYRTGYFAFAQWPGVWFDLPIE